MNLENKIGLAFVALLFLVGISANANKALRGFAAQDADSSQVDSTPGDSQVINEASVVDEVIWVVGDEPILKSEVEATRLQSEAEGIKYAGDPDCSIPEQIALQKLFLHQAAIDSIEVSESEVMNGIDEQINYWVSLAGSMTSFAGESQARMRYTYFASVAKKEGYEQIAAIFTETADQEKEHAKRMFKFLEGGMVEITASYPAGVIGNTLQNLQAAAAGEHEEWSLDYPHFADVAEQEGFPMIAAMYRNISIAEKGHEERYLAFVKNIEVASVFAKEGEVVWQCRNCGYIEVGKEAPEVCPACLHPQAYFEIKKENY